MAGLTAAYALLRATLTEEPTVIAARLDAVCACLAMAGIPTDSGVTVSKSTSDGWVLLGAGQARIGCVVVDISGAREPAVIALLSAPANDEQAAREVAPQAGALPLVSAGQQRGAGAARPQPTARSRAARSRADRG
jgi:hypothetical protein